jgi:hypothetical protein
LRLTGTTALATLWAFALAAAGCHATAADLDGVYRASTHTEDKMGCGLGTDPGDHPIFRLERVDVFGTRAYKYELCTSTQASSCLDLGILSVRFTDEISDGWSDDTYNGTAASGGCTLTHSTSMVTRTGDATVRVEFQKFSSTLTTAPSGGCDNDAARAASATLPCVSSEVLLASRVN